MRFSEHFGIKRSQAELDFVDIDPARDRQLVIDPYAFVQRNDPLARLCGECVVSFFDFALELIRAKRDRDSLRLFGALKEPNETCLGQSKNEPAGRGLGRVQGEALYRALAKSSAVATGVIDSICEGELFVPQIGPDKISDLTTNVVRSPLIQYTQAQCRLHNIPTHSSPLPPTWDTDRREWVPGYHDLPRVDDKPILLIPKGLVRFSLAMLSDDYYNDYAVEFLQDEALESRSSLVRTLKSGELRRPYKKTIKALHPFSKEWLLTFSQQHPKVLDRYRRTRRSVSPNNRQLDPELDENEVARALVSELREIPPGNHSATRFHHAMTAALEFLFYPHLQDPRLEAPLHEGRKRIDIRFHNTADSGFFLRQLADSRIGARDVVIECKNYAKDIANAELDQLAGRFGIERGRLGFVVSRSFNNRGLFVARCRDTAKDGNGYIIPLVDADIIQWLEWFASDQRGKLDGDLNARLFEIIS